MAKEATAEMTTEARNWRLLAGKAEVLGVRGLKPASQEPGSLSFEVGGP